MRILDTITPTDHVAGAKAGKRLATTMLIADNGLPGWGIADCPASQRLAAPEGAPSRPVDRPTASVAGRVPSFSTIIH